MPKPKIPQQYTLRRLRELKEEFYTRRKNDAYDGWIWYSIWYSTHEFLDYLEEREKEEG